MSASSPLLAWVLPALFALCLFGATLPQLIAEPQPRVVVGQTVDVGSHVLTLLAPSVTWLLLLAAAAAAGLYVLVRALCSDSNSRVARAVGRLFASEED